MSATLTLIGNEGFHVAAGGVGVFIDAFYTPFPWVGSAPVLEATRRPADLILVTHAHWDHFGRDGVAAAAARTGAAVAGPHSVCRAMEGRVPNDRLIELEPTPPPRGGFAAPTAANIGPIRVMAFRTPHSRDHNSYLVELPGFRLFHDGDNEHTACLDAAALRPLDALLIAPWRGSGWADLVRAVAAPRWLLMHLTEEEIREHEAGTFLPESCDCPDVPENLVVLRPGESLEIK